MQFYLKSYIFQNGQKDDKYLGYFCKTCHQYLQQMAQFGHTASLSIRDYKGILTFRPFPNGLRLN